MAKSYYELVRSLNLVGSAGLGSETMRTPLRGFTQSQSRRELKPLVQQLFKDPSLVTSQLVDELLKFNRIDRVKICLQTIISRFIVRKK